jgi:hypothetical protein
MTPRMDGRVLDKGAVCQPKNPWLHTVEAGEAVTYVVWRWMLGLPPLPRTTPTTTPAPGATGAGRRPADQAGNGA